MKRIAIITLSMAMLTGCGKSEPERTESSVNDTAVTTKVETVLEQTSTAEATTIERTVSTTVVGIKVDVGTATTVTYAVESADTISTAATRQKEIAVNSGTTEDVVKDISKDVDVSEITPLAASMIGADEGIRFVSSGKRYEIYKFPHDSYFITDALDGSAVLSLNTFGDFEMNSSVNGDYVMLYNENDDAVIDAFMALDLS